MQLAQMLTVLTNPTFLLFKLPDQNPVHFGQVSSVSPRNTRDNISMINILHGRSSTLNKCIITMPHAQEIIIENNGLSSTLPITGQMPRFRRRRMRMRAPITQSVKNMFQLKQSLVPATTSNIQFATTVDVGAPTKVLGTEVPNGAKIFSVLVSVNLINPSATGDGDLEYYFCKKRGGQTLNADFPDPDWTSIGLSDVRNQIFHSELTQFGSEDAGPYKKTFRLKIPRIYQRMRSGDELVLRIEASIASEISVGFLYKYYQ